VGLDSFPAIVLNKAAQPDPGAAKARDANLLIMPPPQAVQAVLTAQVAGALIPPVNSVRAADGGARVILRADDVFSGPVTNNFYVMTESFYGRYPEFAVGFYDAVAEAIDIIKADGGEAYGLLSEDEGGKTSPEKYGTFRDPIQHRSRACLRSDSL
jgi:ABC-type nitrate/sulfonate/bicarbonate transport system substrate-binding protein